MNETNATAGFMMKCPNHRKCGTIARVNVPTIPVQKKRTYSGIATVGVPGSLTHETVIVTVHQYVWDGLEYARQVFKSGDACWTCRRPLKAEPMRGVFSEKHKCNAKCMASTGPACECSCGGKNHGGSYA
jgi:hypothetical protein